MSFRTPRLWPTPKPSSLHHSHPQAGIHPEVWRGVLPPLPRGVRVGVRVIPSSGAEPLTLRSLEEPVPAKAGGRAGSLAPPIRHLSLRPATSLIVIPMPREESRTCPLMPFTYLPLPLPSTEQSATWVLRTHVALCSSFPLSLRALKGEGDQGGEGSPVGSRGIPAPPKLYICPT